MQVTRFNKADFYLAAIQAYMKEMGILQNFDQVYQGKNVNIKLQIHEVNTALRKLNSFSNQSNFLEIEEGSVVVYSDESDCAELSQSLQYALVIDVGAAVRRFVLKSKAIQVYIVPSKFFMSKKIGDFEEIEADRPGESGLIIKRTIIDIY